ncbi:CaiB/BaiF CoA transferase family protein [Bordetella genomosp. 6]|uniref:CaiB/BaiF CoA transferase family protein n=1 Tax=Bordetella genomosp. 6 TaxID=463024 RepID=UPI000A2938C4|nr:CaiB/BaiF CoA-transferase family protein [Bordetella genomosp. 6]ARP74808.1 formyl-CoA transferase [Bordetella genomosp. 6]
MSIKPLAGVRILDFSKVLAGPICTQALQDLGAEVTKVESCDSGDDTRGWPPFREGEGAVFLYANRAKRSIALDLKSDDARAVIRQLVENADVVVESFGPGVAERLRIDYDTLSAINPRLVYCSISGYGRSGPLAHGKGYDMILQAFVGMCSIMGEQGSGPVRAPFSPIDQGTGMQATSAILAALMNRDRTGEGCHIEASLFDTGIFYLGYMFQSFWERGTEPQRFGCAHESLCPYEAYQARDKQILIGVASEALWRKLCDVLQLADMKDDPRFDINARRVAHRELVAQRLNAVLAGQDASHWQDLLVENGIPCAQINSFADALSHPHTIASGIVAEVDSERYGPMRTVGQPVKFNGQRNFADAPAPAHGEHTRAVLEGLGYSEAQIEAMRQRGTIKIS